MIGHEFPYLDTRDLNLDWLLKNMKQLIQDWATYQQNMNQSFSDLETAFNTLKDWIDSYFDNLDVQNEINNKLDAMRVSGELTTVMQPIVSSEAADWLSEHITNPSSPPVDTSLTVAGAAADSAVTGRRITEVKNEIDEIANVSTENLVDYTIFSPGYYIIIATGGLGVNADWTTTGYIELTPNTTYTITKKFDGYTLYALYTAESTDGFTRGVNLNRAGETATFTTSATEKYIRLSSAIADQSYMGVYDVYFKNPEIKDNVVIPTLLDKLEVNPTAVNPGNYTTVLPDANIIKNSAYKMYFSLRSTSIPAHLPFDSWITDKSVMLITFGNTAGSNAGCQQLCVGDNFVFIRQYTSAWEDWRAIKLEINVGSGYGVVQHFTSLTAAVVFATKYKNALVNVYNGTFNLYNEFIAYYGADFFTNYQVDTRPRGLHLTNNVHIKCAGNSKIVFNYTGDNVNVLQQFSPINYLADCVDGFTLENATVECSRCRYVVHDDPGDTSRAYHNKYINCKFSIDNSNNASWEYESVIGGGLGRSGAVTIEGCILKSNEFMTGSAADVHRYLSYHNDINTDAACSSVEIKNSYIDGNGKIVIYYGGTSTTETPVMITNNSMGADIVEAPTRDQDTTHNMDIIAWNNVIRE